MRSLVVFTRFDGSIFSTRKLPRAHAIAAGLIRPAGPQSWERQLQEIPQRFGCPAWLDRQAAQLGCWRILTSATTEGEVFDHFLRNELAQGDVPCLYVLNEGDEFETRAAQYAIANGWLSGRVIEGTLNDEGKSVIPDFAECRLTPAGELHFGFTDSSSRRAS